MRQSEMARQLGISRQRVHQLARNGMPLTSIAAATAWRAEHLSPEGMFRASVAADRREFSTSTTTAPKSETEAHWRTRRARADALLREAELARLNGLSLDRATTQAGWVRMITTMRARLLAIPTRIVPMVAAAERGRLADALEAEIYDALHELGGGPDE